MKSIVAGFVCVLGALAPSVTAAEPGIVVSDSKLIVVPVTPDNCPAKAILVLQGLRLDGIARVGSHQATGHKGDYTALIDCTDGTRVTFTVAGPWWQYSVISLYALMNLW